MCQLPEFDETNELLRQPEGLNVHALLPPECRDGNTTQSSPPSPSPDPDPNPTPTTAAGTTVGGASMDTTTQPGGFDGE